MTNFRLMSPDDMVLMGLHEEECKRVEGLAEKMSIITL